MYRDVLGWLGAMLGVAILAPIFLYLITGAVVGFLVACPGGPSGTMVVGASGAESLELSCSAVRTLVKTAVTVGGSAAATLGVAILAVADILRGSGVR
ncbi:hypothetical protein [Haloplanus aerogenes]|uniref:Uncharacterized protein n=1 Tax=Haloplanus aerogenes TaxID=660522 RepID=A0A3M0DQS9_9EURY|nr:hypothetical protein [Haloplanus aerogenes]AZH24360.1 hypothetical protein DU502_02750 [Haloplanus aerogenes]RMB24002.1 hypothetical protein ATH50_1235 [Haloplanus aerogenes]